ncbi:MAG TPA: N-acyl homoserine lactonase family protein [Dehalococcoidia bacterium]|jgi:glyoxylase-like metal-dependent hydrolase (beta-lactamase superfamily II)
MEGRVLPVQAFLIAHPGGVLLFDTGMGAEHPRFDQLLAPTRRKLGDALAAIARKVDDVTAIVNCHLHYDHCGGNSLFPGVPTFVQAREYEARGDLNWYVPDRVEFEGADLRLIDGEEEVTPGVRVVPTPGHTPGHESLVIRDGDGPVILAGQAAYTATEFADPEAEPARGFKAAWNGQAFLQSIRVLRELNPQRVYFSHDAECWAP